MWPPTPSKGGGPLASADDLVRGAWQGASVVARDAPDGIPRPRLNPALPVNPIGLGATRGWDDCENRPRVDQAAGSEASDDVARSQWLAHRGLRHASTKLRASWLRGLGM